jgi:hypothetical protein
MPEKEEEVMKPVLLQEIIERVNEKGKIARASDYEDVQLELIRGKGNPLKEKSMEKTRPKHTQGLPTTHAKHAGDTPDTHP